MVLSGEGLVVAVAVAGLQVRWQRRLECFRHFACRFLLRLLYVDYMRSKGLDSVLLEGLARGSAARCLDEEQKGG